MKASQHNKSWLPLFTLIITTIISIAVFIIAIVVHELAHGYVAFRLGDNTAKDAGRLSLNPIAHADMFGTVLLPLLLVITRSPVVFGWAKPVPVNPFNFKNPRRDMLLTSLAGPASNFCLALFFAILIRTRFFPPESIVWVFLLYVGCFGRVQFSPYIDMGAAAKTVVEYRFLAGFTAVGF